MAGELALERLATAQKDVLCIKNRICPNCGEALKVTEFHDDGELDLECTRCHNTYKEAF